MTQPKQPEDHPAEPTPDTPPDHGVPEGMEEHEPMGRPNSDREKTETVVNRT